MSFTLRSTSNSSIDNERLTRARQAAATAAAAAETTTTTTTLNRFLSFNENQSSSAENRRRLLHSTPNLIELLEDEDDDIDDNQALCHECDTCSKVFASEYGLNHHTNMHHPNQSILCALCNITFRSHRSLKTHKQRRHSTIRTKLIANQPSTPNYSYISSYLVLPFSSKQFPQMARRACEQQRLPLGSFSSKLYQCYFCSISFPCSRTLSSHLLDQHEQYEYKTCQEILSDLTIQVEYDLRTVHVNNDDEFETMKLYLAKQAPYFGLINKQLGKKYQETKAIQQQRIYPRCPHTSRTCANLCLQYLSSYSKLIKNYPYATPIIPKGNPFAQGSILSPMNSTSYSNGSSSLSGNDSNQTNEFGNGRQKRKSGKQMDASPSSPQLKRKSIGNSKSKVTVGKQPVENATKTNETKYVAVDHTTNSATSSASTSITKRTLSKNDYTRSSSISSNSSTSTRSSTNLVQQTSISSPRMSKRRLSPPVVISLGKSSQKRHRSREQQLASSKSETKVIRIDDDDNENDLEQENGEDKDNDSNDDVIPITFEKSSKQRSSKHRQSSSGSVEYVQMLDDDQQSTGSLNNIENIKSKGKINDEEIIICRSPPTARKMIPSSNAAHSKTTVNGHSAKKSNRQQSSPNDEHVRVRCKICGDILEGRSRFSKHVIAMHSHLLDKNMSNPKQQQQQTAIVR